MPTEMQVNAFKQARNYQAGRSAQPRLIVIHFAVTPETPTSAEGVMNYFATTDREASAHLTADNNSICRSVHDWDTAWGAPGANADGLHLEQAGTFQSRKEWLDDYSQEMIKNQSAKAVGYWSVRHNIPLVKLTVSEVADGKTKGVCGHIDVTHAFPTLGTHTDPGPDYPYDVLIEAAHHWKTKFAGGQPAHDHPATVKHNPYPVPHTVFRQGSQGDKVRFVQWALGIPVDGKFGAQTEAAVRSFQRHHHLNVDGVCGPQTLRALASITH